MFLMLFVENVHPKFFLVTFNCFDVIVLDSPDVCLLIGEFFCSSEKSMSMNGDLNPLVSSQSISSPDRGNCVFSTFYLLLQLLVLVLVVVSVERNS